MRYVVAISLALVGVIHLLPLGGVFGGSRLFDLYGVEFVEPNLEILMRHRAVLFGLLGSFLLFAALKKSFQLAAFVAGWISVLAFIYLAWSVGGYNEHIGKIILADMVAAVLLVIGGVAYLLDRRRTQRRHFLGRSW